MLGPKRKRRRERERGMEGGDSYDSWDRGDSCDSCDRGDSWGSWDSFWGEKKEMEQSTMTESSSTIAVTTAMSSLSMSGDLLIC